MVRWVEAAAQCKASRVYAVALGAMRRQPTPSPIRPHFHTMPTALPTSSTLRYAIGVDGGGSGTRVRLCRGDGHVLGEGQAGPSALGQGAAAAWLNIEAAVRQALGSATLNDAFRAECALGLGLSGAENPGWVAEFQSIAPRWGQLHLVTDGEAGVLGAFTGQPGAIVSVGTGSVGVARSADGGSTVVGGWGWQLGDEAGGAWLGCEAMRLAQHASDGRAPVGALARAVSQQCGDSRHALLDWCAAAGQAEFAAFAPAVFAHEAADPAAAALLQRAVQAVEHIIVRLDPTGRLPLVIAGGIGLRLMPRLRAELRARCVPPAGDACDGALYLLGVMRPGVPQSPAP